jgi:hypothetical protein
MNATAIAAFRIERRSVAAAIFQGTRLEYTDMRQLPVDPEKAEASALGFINWILSSFDIASAVTEAMDSEDTVRAGLNRVIEMQLISAGPLYRIPKAELSAAFSLPPASSRVAIREVVTAIWPILESNRTAATKLDAVALGLYLQTERLFQ